MRPTAPECRSCSFGALEGLEVCAVHVQDQLGITYRQLDYWTRRGYLRPERAAAGSGYRRTWPAAELAIAAEMARLIGAGLQVPAAARVARDAQPVDTGTVRLAPLTDMTWWDKGRCAEIDGDLWFAEGGGGASGTNRRAKAICGDCEVRAQCLAYAMTQTDLYGIWGGLSMAERARLGAIYTGTNRPFGAHPSHATYTKSA